MADKKPPQQPAKQGKFNASKPPKVEPPKYDHSQRSNQTGNKTTREQR